MGLLLAIEIFKSALFSLQVFIPSTWCQENVAAYYKALVKKCAIIAIFPDKYYQFKWTKLKSSFEIRLYTFVFFVFFYCFLMSLISLTVTTYTLCPLSTTKWLMCENGMNPTVPLSSKSNLQPRPQNNTLVPFRALLQNFWWTHPLLFWEYPPALYPRNEESDLFDWILFMGKTISIDWFTTVWSLPISSLPVRFQTILKWFRKRLFLLIFFGTRLWQSVTINMLIIDRLSNQKQIEITRATAITVWGSNRMSHNLCIK